MRDAAGDMNAGSVVVADDGNREVIPLFHDGERGVMLPAGEEPAACPSVQARICIAAGHINAGKCAAIFVPLDGDTVGGIFGLETERQRQQARADLLKAN